MSNGVRFVTLINETLVVHQLDQVGNNITHTLAWCAKHLQPAWTYNDGSFSCWWEHVTGHHQHLDGCGPEDHEIIPLNVSGTAL